MPKTQKVTKRSRYVSKHYGDDKATGDGSPRNWAAGREERPTKKLLELMCKSGAKTQGKACRTCVSRCRFGEEYLDRMKKGDAMSITFTVLGEPVGKARQRVTRFGTYTPEATTMYENLIKTEYRRQCRDHRFDDKQPLRMEIRAEYLIPATASKVKRAAMLRGEIRPMKKPDWDNVGKVVSDALNKLAYYDDKQIVECTVRKFYSDRPRVEITIEEIMGG